MTEKTPQLPDIKTLIDKAEPADRAELTIVHNAHVAALSALKEQSDEKNLRTYQAAKAALEALSARLSSKYFPTADPAPVFVNRAEAFRHLKGLGYKLGKTKFFSDAKAGLVRFESDGSITEKSLDRYIKLSGILKFSEIGQNKGDEKESVLYVKASKEVEKLAEQIRELKTKNEILEGQFFRRSDFDMEMAVRASVLDAGLRQMVRSESARLVRGVSGDPARAHVLCEMFDGILDRLMREYADTSRFQVILEGVKN